MNKRILYTREYCGNQLNNYSTSACLHGCLQRHVPFIVSSIQLCQWSVLHGGNWDGLVHQHPSAADAAFAHIISSQQSSALSTSISTVMMEKRSSQNTGELVFCIMRGDVPDICFRNTDGEEIFFGLEVGVDWRHWRGDAESKVECRLHS